MTDRQYYYYLGCVLSDCNPFITKVRYNSKLNYVIVSWFDHGDVCIDCAKHAKTDITWYLFERAFNAPAKAEFEHSYISDKDIDALLNEVLDEVNEDD